MGRRVFTIAAAVSALLYVATFVLLALSFAVDIEGSGRRRVMAPQSFWLLTVHNGAVYLDLHRPPRLIPYQRWSGAGFSFQRHPSYDEIKVPLSYPLLLTAILPAIWLVCWRRRRRRGDASLCPT